MASETGHHCMVGQMAPTRKVNRMFLVEALIDHWSLACSTWCHIHLNSEGVFTRVLYVFVPGQMAPNRKVTRLSLVED